MDASTDALGAVAGQIADVDIEAMFHAHFARLARVIARVIHDPGRAEELAVDVLVKWSQQPRAHGEQAAGWLYRTAVRVGLDEWRRQNRWNRLRHVVGYTDRDAATSPEDAHASRQMQQQVRTILARLRRRQAELLVLRSEGLSYTELASALDLNPASVGTQLARAQASFRKEYTKRYGSR